MGGCLYVFCAMLHVACLNVALFVVLWWSVGYESLGSVPVFLLFFLVVCMYLVVLMAGFR